MIRLRELEDRLEAAREGLDAPDLEQLRNEVGAGAEVKAGCGCKGRGRDPALGGRSEGQAAGRDAPGSSPASRLKVGRSCI